MPDITTNSGSENRPKPELAAPFSAERLVRWGDCDPAGVIYTPGVLHFALESIEEFLIAWIDGGWGKLLYDRGMGQPTVHTDIDFLRPIRVEDRLRVRVLIEKVGGASVHYKVEAFVDGEADPYFRVNHVSCYVDNASFKPVPIPPEFREALVRYQSACDGN